MRSLTEDRSAPDKEWANQLQTLFKAVSAFDRSWLKLRDKLNKRSPGASTEAGMKDHCLFDILSGRLLKLKNTAGRVSDLNAWNHLGPWLKDSLLLIDLGYYSDQFFDRREPNGEKVLSKIKPSLLDVPVEVNFKPRVYNGEQRRDQRGFGLIAVYNDEERRYHCDMTNLPVDQFSAESVTRVYALRWQVEILFQTMPGDHS